MEERISLYYKDAGSNKEYHAQLVEQEGGWMVLTQNGKRGGTLQQSKKTATPVAYEVAKAAYEKVVKEKTRKGYTPGAAGSVFVGTDLEERFTGIVPMLLNGIDEATAQALLADAAWVLQQKHDGHRRLIRRSADGRLTGINRTGLSTALPEEVAAALNAIDVTNLVLDGELMGNVFAAFDVLEYGDCDLRGRPYSERLAVLDTVAGKVSAAGTAGMFVTTTARDENSKRNLYAALVENKAEGAVFKCLDSAYVAGRPHSGGNQLKRKFTESASFIVANVHPTKRSVSLSLFDTSQRMFIGLGNCTIPSNHAIPPVGAIVEVEYLYAFQGGSVFQPQYKGVRDDIEPAACTVSQLKYKTNTFDEEDDPTPAASATSPS